jgi:tyrosyl-tRNA synthetase
MTTPYAFYQHWLNTDDRDVPVYLRWFTLFPPDEIEALEAELASRPEARAAQRRLADDLTTRVHGADAAREAKADSATIFALGSAGTSIATVDQAARERLFRTVEGSFTLDAALSAGSVVAALADRGVLPSRAEARRLIQNGGLTINGERITDPNAHMPPPIADEWWEIRLGKRKVRLARLSRS